MERKKEIPKHTQSGKPEFGGYPTSDAYAPTNHEKNEWNQAGPAHKFNMLVQSGRLVGICVLLVVSLVVVVVVVGSWQVHGQETPSSTSANGKSPSPAQGPTPTLPTFPRTDPPPTLSPTLSPKKARSSPKLAADFGNKPGFYHGVASGSPLPSGMILWTRYTPRHATDVVKIEYRIAEVPVPGSKKTGAGAGAAAVNATSNDPNILLHNVPLRQLLNPARNPYVRIGKTRAEPSHDWTVKLDIRKLKPKTQYVYAFVTKKEASPVGKFKTAPSANDPVREGLNVAIFSCSNFRTGYFHAYNVGARLVGLDFWIHLGDYIYERPPEPHAKKERQLQTEPKHDLLTVQDYRLRYATYRTDPQLQKLHATAPLISTWDDHEFADNSARNGARKHDPRKQGPWGDRVQAAVQAYLEWMPLRPLTGRSMGPFVPHVSITQKLEFGKLATLVSFDTRISHRSLAPAHSEDPPRLFPVKYNRNITQYKEEPLRSEIRAVAKKIQRRQENPEIKIAGPAMVNFLDKAFAKSKEKGKPWQILAAPVMMGYNVWPDWSKLAKFAPLDWRRKFANRVETFVRSDRGRKFRSSIPINQYKICASFDSWCGAAVEREQIINNMKTNASAAIVLGGDTHSSWAWKLYANGQRSGQAVAVNIGGPGVTSDGFHSAFADFFKPLMSDLVEKNRTTEAELWQVIVDAWRDTNVGLRYANLHQRGFFALKLEPQEASFEFFHLPHGLVKLDYQTVARQYGPVPPFECNVSLKTKASRPGSLQRVRQEEAQPCKEFRFRRGSDNLLKLLVKPGMTKKKQ